MQDVGFNSIIGTHGTAVNQSLLYKKSEPRSSTTFIVL